MEWEKSERRLAENEVAFREANERIHRGFREVNQLAEEDNQPEFRVGDDTEVSFFCECSNLKCQQRIRLTLEDYGWIHREDDHFIVVPGHESLEIEHVVTARPDFNVVEKNAV